MVGYPLTSFSAHTFPQSQRGKALGDLTLMVGTALDTHPAPHPPPHPHLDGGESLDAIDTILRAHPFPVFHLYGEEALDNLTLMVGKPLNPILYHTLPQPLTWTVGKPLTPF